MSTHTRLCALGVVLLLGCSGALAPGEDEAPDVPNIDEPEPEPTTDIPITATPEPAPEPEGKRSAEDISADVRKVVRVKSGQVKYCYEQRLKANPALAGRIAFDVIIAAGRVTSVTFTENTTGDADLEDCISRKIQRWRFPAEANTTISLPFTFAPS